MAPKFNLQNILDVRHQKVELLEVELSNRIIEKLDAQNLLISIQNEQKSLMDQITRAMSNNINLFTLSFLRMNCQAVTDQIPLAINNLENAKKNVEDKRTELVKAKQDEETLNILKQKGVDRWNANQLRVEMGMQDDIYISRAFHQEGQEG